MLKNGVHTITEEIRMILDYFITMGKAIMVFLNGQCSLKELYAMFDLVTYAYYVTVPAFALYYNAITGAFSLALGHTIYLPFLLMFPLG